MDKKRHIMLILAVFFVSIGLCNQVQAKTLPDIKGHWAKSEIEMLLNNNIAEGRRNSNGRVLFYPESNITRAEFIVMLVSALPEVKPKNDTTVFSYKDTHNHWAEPFIEAATDAGITGGVGDNLFLPNEPIKRYEIAVMLVRAKKVSRMRDNVKNFSDVDQEFWFNKTLTLARSNGLIAGDINNKFKPFSNSTRAETSAMIARLLYK